MTMQSTSVLVNETRLAEVQLLAKARDFYASADAHGTPHSPPARKGAVR